jgi:hypothetical protein
LGPVRLGRDPGRETFRRVAMTSANRVADEDPGSRRQGIGSVLGSYGCGFSKGRDWSPAAVPARPLAETDGGVGALGNGVIWYCPRLPSIAPQMKTRRSFPLVAASSRCVRRRPDSQARLGDEPQNWA